MAAKKRKQKQTLKEFRAWLMGVEELQPDGWCPNRDQWVLIRARIDGIIEEKKVVETVIGAPQNNNPIYQNNPQAAPRSTQEVIMTAPQTGGVPAGQVAMTPEAQKMLQPTAGVKAKTPDIDTSDGNVKSAFA